MRRPWGVGLDEKPSARTEPAFHAERIEFSQRFRLLLEREQRLHLRPHLCEIEIILLHKQDALNIQPVPFTPRENFMYDQILRRACL